MLLRAFSMAFWIAAGTSLDLPLPIPIRPSPLPTTARAAKPNCLPPLTTLATRLMSINFSSPSLLATVSFFAIAKTPFLPPWRPLPGP